MNKISSKHFILFIIGVCFISLKTYSSIFINLGGRDTWLCALIASVLFIAYLSYLMHICKATNTYDLNKIFTSSIGKVIGTILLAIIVLTMFLTAIECAAVEANTLHSTLFLETPVWYALAFFLFPSLFLLNKDIRTLLIFILIGVSSLIINSIIILLISEGYQEIKNLLPVLGNGLQKQLFITSIYILGSLCSFIIAFPFLKFVNKYHNIKKYTFFAGIISSVIVVVGILGVITSFGPLRAANIFYPEFVLCQRVQIAGFIELGELFFIFQIVIGFFTKYILTSFSILIICNKFLKNKKIFIGVYTFLVFILASFVGRNNYLLYDALNYLQIINLISFLALPLIVFTIYYLRFKNVPTPQKK